MELSGSLTITVTSEQDMVLIGELLQKRKQEAIQSTDAVSLSINKKPANNKDDIDKEDRRASTETETKVLSLLRKRFPNTIFDRHTATSLIRQAIGLSDSVTGHILGDAVRDGIIHRPSVGKYTFVVGSNGDSEPKVKKKRRMSEKRMLTLKTLQNALLWKNFLKTYRPLNPDFDFDSHVDRILEPEEALNELQKKHPEFKISDKPEEIDYRKGYDEYLENSGVTNPKVRKLLIDAVDRDAFTEEEVSQVATILGSIKKPDTDDVSKPGIQ